MQDIAARIQALSEVYGAIMGEVLHRAADNAGEGEARFVADAEAKLAELEQAFAYAGCLVVAKMRADFRARLVELRTRAPGMERHEDRRANGRSPRPPLWFPATDRDWRLSTMPVAPI